MIKYALLPLMVLATPALAACPPGFDATTIPVCETGHVSLDSVRVGYCTYVHVDGGDLFVVDDNLPLPKDKMTLIAWLVKGGTLSLFASQRAIPSSQENGTPNCPGAFPLTQIFP